MDLTSDLSSYYFTTILHLGALFKLPQALTSVPSAKNGKDQQIPTLVVELELEEVAEVAEVEQLKKKKNEKEKEVAA